jgi:polyisoprenoid-binding protein YceI
MKIPFLLLLGLLLPLSGARASDVHIKVSLSPAGSFVAKSEALRVRGSTGKTGDLLKAQELVLPLDTLKTGIALRDEHMRKKYFETDKYPDAVLTQASGKDGKFTGELSLHGTKKPISGTYELKNGQFIGSFPTRLSDFGIAKARYLGVGVEDQVQVEVTLPAAPQTGK